MQPHSGNPMAHAGAPIDDASTVMILVHGRNAAPKNILDLFVQLDRPNVAAVAPAAAGGTWYPYSFLAPRDQNEPGISSGLVVLEMLVIDLLKRGFSAENLVLLGFSQGACLTAEFAFRHARLYGGVMVLSGGLIGPPGTTWTDATAGSLDQVPVFLGCSDVDAHIPKERVLETEAVFNQMGARVTRRFYPGMGHLVNDDEIAFVRSVLDDASQVPRGI
jgi:phospholipase/carboxylesterase/glyoxalase family protein